MTQTKKVLPIIVLTLGLLVSYSLIAQATSEADITFPVAELANCGNKEACHNYCDQPDNYRACFAFAKKHNLLEGPLADKDEQELDRFAQVIQQGGPGGCQSQSACETYCNDVNHIEECLAFGEQHGLLAGKELEEARAVKKALDGGAKLPGDCTSKDSCETYCEDSNHMEECLAFAEAAGFIPPEELQTARRAMELMRSGETPGGCRSKEQCETYCQDENHFEECVNFGVKMGFIPPEEIEMIKKVGKFGGPGGCKGKEGCDAFCRDPANVEICFNFAKEHGFISEEEAAQIHEGPRKILEALDQAPPEVAQCIKTSLSPSLINDLRSGQNVFIGEEIRHKIEGCFEQFMPRTESFMHDFPPEVAECVKSQGGDFSKPPTPDLENTIRSCFEQFGPKSESFSEPRFEGGGEFHEGFQPPPGIMPIEIAPEQKMEFERQYQEQYQQQFEQQYQQEYEQQNQTYEGFVSPEDYCRQNPSDLKCQQVQQQQYYQEPAPTIFPTSPEDYCKQYPEKCEQMQQEYRSSDTDTYQLQSHYPTLQEFLLGLLYELIL